MRKTFYKINIRQFDDPVVTDYINRTTDTTATTGNDLSTEVRTYYDRTLLENAQPNLVHDQFAQQRPIPQNAGQTIDFTRFDKAKPLPSKALLQEGITPNGMKLNTRHIATPLRQYGAYYELSDWLDLTSPHKMMTEVARNLGDHAGETLDTVTREAVMAGTNAYYGDGTVNARASITAAMGPTKAGFRKCRNILSRADAKPFEGGKYVAIIHPDTWLDMAESIEDIYKYTETGMKRVYEGEIGVYFGIRFVETSRAKIFASAGSGGRDVYASLMVGRNAYAVTAVTGRGLETIAKQLGSGGTTDPLNQRSTMGWKANKAVTILDETAMVRYEHATSTNLHDDDLAE